MAVNPFGSFAPEWWREVVGGSEPLQYYSSGAGRNFASASPRRQRYFGNAYQDILQDYYGHSGQKMRQGQEPITFDEFLDTDPWTKRYTSLPQTARGATGMAFNPFTRRIFNY
mgnify:FL=1|tara:strand:+ start:308 stop:646 length:339 start_codon:yes stop_codon:yes gene_type:complete